MQLALRYYRKIPKISPGAYIFQWPFLGGLSTEGNLHFKINWASLIVRSKVTIFAFFFVFEGNFQAQDIWRGDLTKCFCVTGFGGLYLEGLIHRGAYFRNFTVPPSFCSTNHTTFPGRCLASLLPCQARLQLRIKCPPHNL